MEQQQQAPTLQVRDAEAPRDVCAGLCDLPGSRFFESWDDAQSSCAYDDDDPTTLRVAVLTLGTGLVDSPGLAGALPASLTSLSALIDLVLYPGQVKGSIPSASLGLMDFDLK